MKLHPHPKRGLRLNPRPVGAPGRAWIFLSGLVLFLILGWLLPVNAQESPAETQAVEATSGTTTAGDAPEAIVVEVDWWAQLNPEDPVGRIIMLALAFLLVLATAFTLERLYSVRGRNFAPNKLVKQIQPLWNKGRFNDVAEICKKDSSILALVALYIARHYRAPYEILQTGAGDIGARELKRQYQKSYPLAVIAMLSPLLGLLGTVIGMIGAFNTVAEVGEMGDASVLAGDIGLALITTAVGLIIAIPTLGIYHVFRQRISMFGNQIEEELEELFQAWLRPLQEVEEWKEEAQPVDDANGANAPVAQSPSPALGSAPAPSTTPGSAAASS
ncbi:MAG: MotA/TolQ/ExbB proton channel family protein [Opitutales bacterium]